MVGSPPPVLVGRQKDTLILGPGYDPFGNVWRMSLPLGLFVVAVSPAMLLWVPPL